jgi:hypothetical protein
MPASCVTQSTRHIEDEFMQARNKGTIVLAAGVAGAALAAGCTPTVRVEVPDKPIEINLNINMKIEQNVRVKLDRELDRVAQQNPGIF